MFLNYVILIADIPLFFNTHKKQLVYSVKNTTIVYYIGIIYYIGIGIHVSVYLYALIVFFTYVHWPEDGLR